MNSTKCEPGGAVQELLSAQDWRRAAAVMRVLRPTLEVEDFMERRTQLLDEGYHLLGVEDEGRVLSIASYTVSPHVILTRELLVHDMATLPEARRRGYASLLIEELSRVADEYGCGRIFVHTREAQALYLRNGFEEYSTGMIRKLRRNTT